MYIDEIRKIYKDVNPQAVIKIQNIVDFIFKYPDQEVDPVDVFSYKAPFFRTWLEFKMPQYMNNNGKQIEIDKIVSNKEIGILITTEDHDKDGDPFGEFFKISFDFYMEIRGKNTHVMNASAFPFNSGKIEENNDLLMLPSEEFATMLKELSDENAKWVLRVLYGYSFAPIPSFFNFYHCKNVKIVKTDFDKKLIKARAKRGQKDYFEHFHTVRIEPMRKVLKDSFNCDKIGVNKALQAYHIVPGHEKIYKKDENGKGGLFGKFEGVWWWENFVKGSKEVGVIHKDYDVDLKNITKDTKLIPKT